MPEKKRFKCEICDYILEHDGEGDLPLCPKCGDKDSWLLLDVRTSNVTDETGFGQVIPPDITAGDVSAMALGNIATAPTEVAAGERAEGDDPFARPVETGFEQVIPQDINERYPEQAMAMVVDDQPGEPVKLGQHAFAAAEETGFEHVIPHDITESAGAHLPQGALGEPDADEPGPKIDDYAFKRPRDTGFEQIVPNDITEGDTSRAAYGSIIGPSGEGEGKGDGHAFAAAEETGFEQVIPLDITEGDTTRVAFGNIAGLEGEYPVGDSQAFARPEQTGFEQVIPVDFNESVSASVDVTALPLQGEAADQPERKPGVNPFAQPAETGFDQVIPQDFTEGGKVNINLGQQLDQAEIASIAKLFRCEMCGALLKTDKDGDLPACPTCGAVDKWEPAKE